MLPVINLIRSLALGPFLVLAYLVGAFLFWKKGKEEYYDEYQLLDILVASSFWGLVAARLGFIIAHINDFGFDILKWFSLITYPGYVGFVGVIVGTLILFKGAQKRKWDAFEIADFGAIALSCAVAIIALGTFVNGSSFGNPTSLPIGMTFPGVFDARHPTQLYAMILYTILCVLLWRLERVYRTFLWYRENRRTAQSGFVFAVFCIGYGAITAGMFTVQQPSVSVFFVPIDPIVGVLSIFVGLFTLFVRSGRTLGIGKKKTALHQPAQV